MEKSSSWRPVAKARSDLVYDPPLLSRNLSLITDRTDVVNHSRKPDRFVMTFMRILKNIIPGATLVIGLGLSVEEVRAEPYNIAILQGMDKVTARVSTMEAPIGDTVHFGTLEIITRTCDKRPPEETPESAAFLDIWDVRPGEAALSIFRGWMMASSPALNALEHPVYDVWVLDCKDKASSSLESLPSDASASDTSSSVK